MPPPSQLRKRVSRQEDVKFSVGSTQTSIQIRQSSLLIEIATFRSAADLDQLQEVATGAALEIVQLERGNIWGCLGHLELGSSSVHFNHFSLSARGHGAAPEDRWSFCVFPEHVAGVFNGQQLQPNEVLAYRPGVEFAGTTYGVFADWVFTVEDAMLRRTVRSLFHCELPPCNASCITLRPGSEQIQVLRHLAKDFMIQGGKLAPPLWSSPELDTRQAKLTHCLAKTLLSGQAEHHRRVRSTVSHARIVREMEEYVSAHYGESLCVADLCELADVSERTLRSAFRNVLGVSPNAYLKIHRLHRARIQLQAHTPDATTVTKVALSSGFWHLGHFARDYAIFFGESPSQTLTNQGTSKSCQPPQKLQLPAIRSQGPSLPPSYPLSYPPPSEMPDETK